MSRQRMWRWAATSTRLVVGAALAVGMVGAVGVGVAANWPTHTHEPLAVGVTPTPADTVLACAGPLLALGRDATQAGQIVSAAPTATVSGSDGASLKQLTEPTAPVVIGSDGHPVFVAPPVDETRSDAAASASGTVGAEDLRGFAASACQPPLIESWLVAGATTTGSADVILLSNPSDVAATVDLTLYSATGASTPPSGSGLRVDAHSQRLVPLAALAVGEGAPVVRVTASGAPVAAALQSSLSRTLLTGGVEQSGAIVGSATQQVIPGLRVPQSAVDAASAGATTLLRLLAPGADATATVTVQDDTGRTALTQSVPLGADLPTELDLAGLSAGTYTVRVDATSAVVSAVWQTTNFNNGADFAWYTAAEAIVDPSVVAVADGPSPLLVIAGSTAGAADVVLKPLSGATETERVRVAAGDTASVPVEPGAVYRIETSNPIRASVSYLADGAISAFPVWPADAAAAEIIVRP